MALKRQEFTFVFTDGEGKYVFGYCLQKVRGTERGLIVLTCASCGWTKLSYSFVDHRCLCYIELHRHLVGRSISTYYVHFMLVWGW